MTGESAARCQLLSVYENKNQCRIKNSQTHLPSLINLSNRLDFTFYKMCVEINTMMQKKTLGFWLLLILCHVQFTVFKHLVCVKKHDI